MQTWNQWQVSSDAVTPSGSQPAGYVAASATDPMAMMQTHLQYYNQPAPSGYTPEQWARKVQQEWVQWQQWQQQYQQWQAQYGEKYQQTMHHLSMQNLNLTNQAQLLSNIQPPLLSQENTAPPLSLTAKNTYQFINMPPPHQNNLPLFPAKEPTNTTQTNATNHPQNPPLPTYQPINQPPLPPDSCENKQNISSESCESNVISEYNSAKNKILEDNEKTEAEKTFDAQFKQWEEQFNKWKEQNADHPDKTQYKQYEAKWTAWREKLIERREQMRKKREQQKQVTTKTEVEKTKNIAGDNKIMDILSNTENQGLINNLLGIGKTLGLTGKQDGNVPLPPPPPPPPPPPENTSSNQHLATQAQQTPQVNMTTPVASSWSNQQQWPSQQHNSRMNVSRHGPELPGTDTISTIQANIGLSQITSPNFSQPPPNIAQNCPQFSSNFSNNDRSQLQSERASANERNGPAYDLSDSSNMNMRFMHSNDRSGPNFNRLSSFRRNDQEHLGQDNISFNLNERVNEDQFKSTDTFDRAESHCFRGDDRNYNDFANIQLNRSNNFNPNNERFGLGNDHFGQNNDRLVRENNRFRPMENDKFGDRFRSCNDRFNNERFRPNLESDRFTIDKDRHGPGNSRFGPPFGSDRFPLNSERFVTAPGFDRFPSSNNRFGSNNELLRPNDRFGRGNVDYFNSKDGPDLRRDSFDINPRGGFNRNLPFSPLNELPELKKLMEKRKAAGDVFKPSFVDSEKCSNVGSLSESFKKIAGGSLFKNSFDFQKNRNDESAILLNKTSNFEQHCHSEIEQSSTSLYRPRSHPFNRNEPFFREFSDTFAKSNSVNYNDRLDKNMEIKSHHTQSQTSNVQSQDSIKHSDDNKAAGSSLETNSAVHTVVDTVIELNETNNTNMQTDVVTSEDISEENKNKEECQINDNDTSLERNDKEYNNQTSNVEITKEVDNKDSASKQSESLPFMDENDPPPENLNIEPPPELPNLPPVSTNLNQNPLSSNNNCNENKLIGNQFNLRFDAREIEVKGSGFGSREPPTFNSFGPSEPHTLPMDPVFQPRNSLDKDLSLQVFNDNQLGSNENSFRRSNTEQYNRRNQESLTDSNDRQFDRRGFMDEQFGQYGSRNFGPSGPKCFDRHIESKNQIDVTFATSKSGLFELKDNDMQYNPKSDSGRVDFRSSGFSENYFGSRGPNDAFSGPRKLDDTPSGFRDLSNPQCGSTEFNRFSNTNEVPFEKKLSFDKSGCFSFSNEKSLGSRNYVKGLPFSSRDSCSPNNTILNSHNLNDTFLQRNPNTSTENQIQSRNLNNRPFRSSDLKGKDLMNDSNNPYFSPLEDSSCNRSDYARRDSYVRKGQFEDDISTKRIRYKSPNEFNKTFSDRNIGMEIQKNYPSDIKNVPDKTGLEKISHKEYRPTDIWKDKFGNDQITDKGQHDIDYKSKYNESVPGLDFQSTHTFDVFKRPQPKTGKEFCAPKQFNYNHGEVNKKCTEPFHFTPAKVIDYEHKSRSSIIDQHLTPVQSFDYGHGNLKPVTLNREEQKQHYYSKTDFRNWVESEQNLKEYTDTINNLKNYKNKTNNYDAHKSLDCNKRKKQDWQLSDKKFDGQRRENNRKERECNPESSYIDFDSEHDQNNRYQSDINVLKGQTQEICESSKEMNKDINKDDIRLKGNISCQENSNKNVVDTKIQEISISSDTKKNVAESSPQTLELSRLPNHTMVDDLLCPPGRQNRPPKIAIILRGPPGSGKSFVAKLIKDKEVEQGGSAPRILSLDDYFLVEKEIETLDDGKKVKVKEMVYEYEEAMEQSYIASLCKAFKKNITDGFFTFIILDCINEKISDYEDMWSFAKTKGFKVYVCEMEMDPQICLKRNIHNRTEDEINRIIDYFEPTPSYHQKLDVNSMLQEQAIEEVDMEDSQETQKNSVTHHEDSQDSQQDTSDESGVSKWERMEAEDKLDRLDGLAKKKNETKPQTMEDFLQVPDYYDMEDTSGKKRVRWADLEERKKQEKMRAVGFVVGHTNWDRMMDPTKGGSALTRTKYI